MLFEWQHIVIAIVLAFGSGVCAGMAWTLARLDETLNKWESKDREFVDYGEGD